jgi:glutathione synthase/RimK-type ligase-like ATP-grasp enzyme
MKNRIVGIFIPLEHYESIKKGIVSASYQQFELAADTYGLIICFLTTNSLKDSNEVHILIKDKASNAYTERTAFIPKVIYNRVSLRNKKIRKILNYFIQTGSNVFNVTPIRNSKYFVNKLLEKEPHIVDHLPKTVVGSKNNLQMLMKQYDSLFIKPCYSSVGKGIMYLEKHNDLEWFFYERSPFKNSWEKSIFTNQEKTKLGHLFQHRSFIIQEKIPLATYKNRPFDVRVIVQKNTTGNWHITGMVAKLAPKDQLITNVGRGGEIGDLQQYLFGENPSYLEVEEKINTLAIDVALALEKNWPHIADLGLDIGVNEKGKPFFIECNLRGRYGSFKKQKDLNPLWKNIHHTPISYAEYLLKHYN